MRVTKYPQSCLLVEQSAGRLLIDPGDVALQAYSLEDFGAVDAVLYTHRHTDHFDRRHVEGLVERGVQLFANADVCGLIGEGAATAVADGDSFEVAGFQVTARNLTHVPMVDGSPGPPNTGYLVAGKLFHPGDGMELAGLQVDTLALPIAGPSISFRDAYRFAASVGAHTVVPMHYDTFLADPEQFGEFCDIATVVVLGPGESVEL